MSRGFTLIEVVVVVLVLGIVAAVTVPAFQRLDGRDELATAADQVAGVLRSARLTSLERGAPVEVIVNPSQRRYWVWEGSAPACWRMGTSTLPLPTSSSPAPRPVPTSSSGPSERLPWMRSCCGMPGAA